MTAEDHVAKAREMLADVYRPEGVEIWLHGARRQFGGESPRVLLADGRHQEVFDAIERLRVGAM